MEVRFMIVSVLIVLLGLAQSEDAFNKMIDRVLVKLENDLNNGTNKLSVNIPDAVISIKKNVLWLNLNGIVQLKNGVVRSMSGLEKVGEARLAATNGGDMIITVSVSWSDLTLHYDIFKYYFLLIDIDDSLTVQVKNNVVLLNATFHYDTRDKCSMTLNSVDVTSFGGFSSSLQPSKWYKSLNDIIVDFVLRDQSPQIMGAINQHLTSNIENVVTQMNLCHYLPY